MSPASFKHTVIVFLHWKFRFVALRIMKVCVCVWGGGGEGGTAEGR
jgi:hypothetical protein